jgi:hypothetical protein
MQEDDLYIPPGMADQNKEIQTKTIPSTYTVDGGLE